MICTPALLYLILCCIQILLDFTQGLYNIAYIKILITIVMTFVLNTLCNLDLGIISWFIVLIPFFFMTIISSVILVSKKNETTNTEQIISPPIETPDIIYTSPPLSPWLLPDVPEQLPQEPIKKTNNTSFPITNGLYLIM